MRNEYSEGKLKPYIVLDEKVLVKIKKKTLTVIKTLAKYYHRIIEWVNYENWIGYLNIRINKIIINSEIIAGNNKYTYTYNQ